MFKPMLAALSLAITCGGIACAQAMPGNQFTAGQGAPGTTNMRSSDPYVTSNASNWPFMYQPPNNFTSNQTQKQNASRVPMATSMPFPGTHFAPGNIAGMWWGGPNLPITNMDSFVYQSGMDFDIYGDEGTWGPPPLFTFDFPKTIEQGIEDSPDDPTITTGHRAPLPSAWLDTTQP